MNKDEKLINMLNRSSRVVGCRQVLRGMSEGIVRCVIISEDADEEVRTNLIKVAAEKNVEVISAQSMDWLGKQAGIEVGTATVGIINSEE